MSRQIIKQPSGEYCVFSSISDNVVYYNMSPQEIIEVYVEEYKEQITEEVKGIIDKLEDGGKPYRQFTESYESMMGIIKEVYGKREVKFLERLMKPEEK